MAYVLVTAMCAALLSGGLLVRIVRNSTKPLPAVHGGTAGDLLKPKPSLPLPTGAKPHD